jgi:hypothetical protein
MPPVRRTSARYWRRQLDDDLPTYGWLGIIVELSSPITRRGRDVSHSALPQFGLPFVHKHCTQVLQSFAYARTEASVDHRMRGPGRRFRNNGPNVCPHSRSTILGIDRLSSRTMLAAGLCLFLVFLYQPSLYHLHSHTTVAVFSFFPTV